jgi:gamma-glutamylcyclotransferase (GGCT)/AIG2-like uncharacterized protein YtfP
MRRASRPHVVHRNSGLAGNRPSRHHRDMRVFLYGMLLDPITLTRHSGPTLPARLIPARLIGWRRVTLRGTPWPTLRRDRTAHVTGAVLHLSAAALARLRKFEEPPYLRRWVVVTTARGKTCAFAWIAPGATSRPWPPRRTPP